MCLYLYTPADSAAKIRAMCLTPHNNNTNSGAKRQNSHYYWRRLEMRRESRHMAVTAGAVSLKRHSIMKRARDQKRRR